MAVAYTNAVKCARMDALTAQMGTAAKLEIGTAGMGTILATFTLNNPAAAAASGAGVLTLSGFPKTVAASAAGTAVAARIRTSANVDLVTGLTVGTSGADINLDTNVISAAGQNVTLNASPTITHA